jgi:hypothetical protein
MTGLEPQTSSTHTPSNLEKPKSVAEGRASVSHSLYTSFFGNVLHLCREPGRALCAYQKNMGMMDDGVWRGRGVALHLCLKSYQRMRCVCV